MGARVGQQVDALKSWSSLLGGELGSMGPAWPLT